MNINKTVFYLSAFLFSLVLFGCSSSELVKEISAEEHFLKGKEYFDDESFLEAIEEFKVVGLQYSGSDFADDAQLYLGECYFERSEYLLAAYEFEMLKKRMASSPLVPVAQFKIALCYYRLSPKSSLDQKNTTKAIDEFQAFLEYYPKHDSAIVAAKYIRTLNNRLAKKEYETAKLYLTLEEYQAAQHYFEKVLERYHDTEYADDAYLGKAEVLLERKKYAEAKTMMESFYEKYPASTLREKADTLRRDIESIQKEKQSMDDKNPKPNQVVKE
ncbi:MAG: outer membrane protein assembly factor BamD [Ignavibacteriales bacterium]|nr:outer membrane protein assembly factor BamD [Ignavibacteriales bacterium]